MSDGSSSLARSLKNEWNLLWESLVPEKTEASEKKETDPFLTGKIEALSLDQLREMTKSLSDDRRQLNQKIEKIKKELELNTAKLESLRLVGNTSNETLQKIEELNDLGQSVAEAMEKVDQQLRYAHRRENALRSGF